MASEEQQKLASIIETSPDLIGIADLEGRLLYLNAAGQNLVGIDDIGDVRHKPVRQFFLEADYRMFETEIMPSVLQAGRWSGIVAYRHFKTGAPVPVEMKVFMIRDKKTDQPIALANISRDITERKRAEEALRESERSLKTLMSNLPGMAYRCRNDRNYTMEYVSEGTSALTGYLPKDLLGNAKIAFNDLIHPDDQGQVWDVVQKAIGQKEKYTLNYRIRKADGQERWVWEQGQGVFSETGDLLALEGFIIDVTERRLLEEERLKTQKIESIGTLAGGIAHDFNNLLQGIFGYISMAKITIDQREKALAMIDQAEKALHQTVSLTTQLLTFSKGGKPLMKNIRLIPVIENAVKFSLSGSRVDYDMDIDAGLWTVEGDEGQIGQVIQNLVINADQAMPMGGRIVIKARNMQAPGEQIPVALSAGNYVEISVQDSGIGIPNQYLESIFDPYFTTKEKGSGLGLAISYSIIRNHGGTIHVASEAGRGSTFSVYLPATAESPAAPASREVTGPTRKGRILLMDDEALVRAIATEMIKALGHEVECCTHGEECISKYLEARQQGTPFDVVILDLTIRGGMGGAEAVRRLLEIERQVKAVVSSGYADDSIIADYRSHGFSATLSKPYDIKALSNTLDALLAS
jgi:PAS domain S-box-containing protein